MAITYSTVAKVKARLRKYSTSISDDDIEIYIEHAEGIVNATMRGEFTTTFDADKHALIENVTTDLAAFKLLVYDPSSFTSITEVSILGDLLWTQIEEGLDLLSDDRTVKMLNGL